MTINIRFFFMLITVLTFAACDDDDDVTIDPVTFDVTIENISTSGLIDTERAMGSNPLSPPVYAHLPARTQCSPPVN